MQHPTTNHRLMLATSGAPWTNIQTQELEAGGSGGTWAGGGGSRGEWLMANLGQSDAGLGWQSDAPCWRVDPRVNTDPG